MLKDLPRVRERFWRVLRTHYLKQSRSAPYHRPTGACTQVKCWERTWKTLWQKAKCYKSKHIVWKKFFFKVSQDGIFQPKFKEWGGFGVCVVQGRKNAKRKNKYQTPEAEWEHWAGTRAQRCRGAPRPGPSAAQRSAERIRKPRIVALVIFPSDMACTIPKFIIYLHLTVIRHKILLQIHF